MKEKLNAVIIKFYTIIFCLVLACCSCSVPAVPPPVSYTEPTPWKAELPPYDFDRVKARAISNAMVDALIKNDRPTLFAKMEKAARDYYDQKAFDDILDKMIGVFGTPIEAKFKKVEQGRKVGTGGYDKPMLKHWYAVRTSKNDYGSNFIFVEIVPDENGYASSGISIVNFPMGVPEDMR